MNIKIDKEREWLKCKLSPLYFIETYAKIPVPGGIISMKESDLWQNSNKYRQLITSIHDKDIENVILMASRQHGKTQTIGLLMLYYLIFYDNLKIEFVTLDGGRAIDFIKRINDMMGLLPKWLRKEKKSKAERLTYIELKNGSKLTSHFVSGAKDPDQVGRGLSASLIYVDEAAFIKHAEIMWRSMQPVISTAKRFAKKNNFPYCVIFSSTPNGAGENFFYNIWQRSTISDEIFIDDLKLKKDYAKILKQDKEKNNFCKIKIHWSETGKDEEWYANQVKELNFNMRSVNQELNLVFLGSNNAVFDDEIIQTFEPLSQVNTLVLAFGEKIELIEELDPNGHYSIGVDVSASNASNSDYSAIIITNNENGKIVGEWHGRYSVLKRFALVVKSLVKKLEYLYSFSRDNLILIIERNSFGLAIIEEIIYDDDYNFQEYLFYTTLKNGDEVPGFQTDATRREKGFNILMEMINLHPENITVPLIQEELRNLIQKSNGRFEASPGQHDDLIMSYLFTLFVRHELIKEGIIITKDNENHSSIDPKRIKKYMDVSFSSAASLEESPFLKKELVIERSEEEQEKYYKYLDSKKHDLNYNVITF